MPSQLHISRITRFLYEEKKTEGIAVGPTKTLRWGPKWDGHDRDWLARWVFASDSAVVGGAL